MRSRKRLALVVDSFQFQPRIVGVDGTAGKEVSDALGANDDIDAHRVTTTNGGLHTIQRRGDWSHFHV